MNKTMRNIGLLTKNNNELYSEMYSPESGQLLSKHTSHAAVKDYLKNRLSNSINPVEW